MQVLQNAARARIYGGEAELTADVVDDLTVRAGVAYTHARYTAFPGAIAYTPIEAMLNGSVVLAGNTVGAANASGDTLVRSPDVTANLRADYTVAMSWGDLLFSGNAYFSDRVFFDPTNRLSQPAYATLDLKVTWTAPNGKLKISVFGDNITDTSYIAQIAPSSYGDGAIYGTPAIYGVSVDYRF